MRRRDMRIRHRQIIPSCGQCGTRSLIRPIIVPGSGLDRPRHVSTMSEDIKCARTVAQEAPDQSVIVAREARVMKMPGESVRTVLKQGDLAETTDRHPAAKSYRIPD